MPRSCPPPRRRALTDGAGKALSAVPGALCEPLPKERNFSWPPYRCGFTCGVRTKRTEISFSFSFLCCLPALCFGCAGCRRVACVFTASRPRFVDKTRRFCTIGVSGAKASPTRAAVPRNRIIFYFPVTRSSVRGRARADAFCWWEKEARSKREMGIRRCASAVCVGTALNQLMALPSVQRVRNLEFGPAKWLEGKCV